MNESAFPLGWQSPITGNTTMNEGMTLRDYFAAKALPIAIQEMNDAESYNINDAAIVAYQYADAMMDARQP